MLNLGKLFALLAGIAAFGIGNMVQAKSVADALQASFQIPPWVTGAGLTLATALVLIGGITSIARTASAIVPVMVVALSAWGCLLVGSQLRVR